MKPLPKGRPLLWNVNDVHAEVEVSRADLVRQFGAPHLSDEEGDGLGPEDYWLLECDCGLELLLRAIRGAVPLCLLSVRNGEVTHALAHLELEGSVVLWSADDRGPFPADGWAVVRQDEHGNREEMAVFRTEPTAHQFAASYESEPRHKQAYFVEPVTPRS